MANLEAAFAGESMALIQYRYFAKICREMGDLATAEVFEHTCDQEVLHAFGHLDLLYPKSRLSRLGQSQRAPCPSVPSALEPLGGLSSNLRPIYFSSIQESS
jgi:rubrerythrin